MRRHLAYLRYVLTHKFYVWKAGRALGVGWLRLLLHDVSKFSKEEWGPYARNFYDAAGRARPLGLGTDEFKLAVHLHKRRNPHHPTYWERPAGAWPFEMPDQVVREMIADWAGAGKAKTGRWEFRAWTQDHMDFIQLHPDTKRKVWELVTELEQELP